MSCSSLEVARPSPFLVSCCNELCVRQCPDSEVIIKPSRTFPQHSEVRAVGAPAVHPVMGLIQFGGLYAMETLIGGIKGFFFLVGGWDFFSLFLCN
uniref:Uncharacterized protein n=1 Tax=Chelonoidis abingdonii TaxID=106734 RepID=A0A8C0G0Q0_CHEAB